MARAMSDSGSRTSSSASVSASTSSSRVAKRALPRITRQSIRLANAQAAAHDDGQSSVDEAQIGQSADNGTNGGRTCEDVEHEDAAAFYRSICPIIDKDDMPFRLMELPTEIRLEIYRACLTRPYTILLSRQPQLPKAEAGSSSNPLTNRQPPPRHRRSVRATAGDTSAAAPFAPVSITSVQSAPMVTTSSISIGAASTFPLLIPTLAPQHDQSLGRAQSMNELLRNQREDPLLTNILLANKEVYKEARGVMYSENYFTLDLNTAQSTLAFLHQRSRRQIKHIELEIPSYNDILERFQETVRLSLRYCSGLKECRIHMPFMLPGADGSGTSGNTTVYANGFDILRWLPQECNIVLEGTTCVEIEQVVNKHRHLAKTLDKLAYARRQLISNETGQPQR